MDRSIPRRSTSELVHIDSAFRGKNKPTCEYEAFFNSFTNRKSKIIKDVIGIQINKVSLPRIHDNIISGFNIINLHASTSDPPLTRNLTTDLELIQYLQELNPHLTLKTEIKVIKSSRPWDSGSAGKDKIVKVYKIMSINGNQLLSSSIAFPGSKQIDMEHHLLVTQEEKIWDISFPIELSLSTTESHRLLLKPGYYPTASLIISEFFNSVTNPHDGYQVNEDLQYDWNDTSTPNGWSVFKEARGNWTAHFRTSPSNMNIFFSQEPGGFDMLQQLGLRSNDVINWATPGKTYKLENQIFKMRKITVSPNTSSDDNTIIGDNSITSYDSFELNFKTINLFPRRYVDVIVENIPQSSITNSFLHTGGVFARVDLSQNQKVSYSTMNDTMSSNNHETFDESASIQMYVTYENNTNTPRIFDPISLDHLKIKLMDNLGSKYNCEDDHMIEIQLLTLGDALSPFDFPVADTGSFVPPRRTLTDKSKRRQKKRNDEEKKDVHNTNPNPQNPSPITDWVKENKLELGVSGVTFFTVLYITHKLGLLNSPNPSSHHPSA